MKAFLTTLHAKKTQMFILFCIGRVHSPYESSSVGGPFALPFFYTFNNEKGHNMLMLMLDPMYKNIWLVNYLFALWNNCALVVEYEKPLLLPPLLEVYMLLMPNKVQGLDEFISLVNGQNLI